jgi:acylphosphatase
MSTQANDHLRFHIIVTGYVQNVGFRAFVQHAGSRLGVTGWVRNLGDHQVEAVAEGVRPVLDQFASLVKQGPRGSRVEDVNEQWETATGEYTGFIVRSSR